MKAGPSAPSHATSIWRASSLVEWVERAQADRTKSHTGLTTAERDELLRLRRDNRELRLERDILENTAAFFCPGELMLSAENVVVLADVIRRASSRP